jgi:hypothetical protein
LLYSYSSDGTSWTSVTYPLPDMALATGVRGAFGDDHRGFAVWYSNAGGGNEVFALRLGPKVELRLPAAGNPPATARASGANVVVKVKGKLRPPGGVPAADVCAGKLTAVVRRGNSKLRSRRMTLSAACAFSGRISVPRSKVGSGAKLRLQLKLPASKTARAAKRSYKLRLRR